MPGHLSLRWPVTVEATAATFTAEVTATVDTVAVAAAAAHAAWISSWQNLRPVVADSSPICFTVVVGAAVLSVAWADVELALVDDNAFTDLYSICTGGHADSEYQPW